MRGGGSAVSYLFPNHSNSVWAVASYSRLNDSLGEARRREVYTWGVRKQAQICSWLQCAGPWSPPCSSEHLHMSMNRQLLSMGSKLFFCTATVMISRTPRGLLDPYFHITLVLLPNSTNLSRVSLLEWQRRALLSPLQIYFLTDSLKKLIFWSKLSPGQIFITYHYSPWKIKVVVVLRYLCLSGWQDFFLTRAWLWSRANKIGKQSKLLF